MKELEGEVLRLLDRAHKLLRDTTTNFASPEPLLSISGMDYIEEARKRLLDVDVALGDINRIIGGYISYRAPSLQAPAPKEELIENEADTFPVEHEPLVEDIINRFREATAAHEEPS